MASMCSRLYTMITGWSRKGHSRCPRLETSVKQAKKLCSRLSPRVVTAAAKHTRDPVERTRKDTAITGSHWTLSWRKVPRWLFMSRKANPECLRKTNIPVPPWLCPSQIEDMQVVRCQPCRPNTPLHNNHGANRCGSMCCPGRRGLSHRLQPEQERRGADWVSEWTQKE